MCVAGVVFGAMIDVYGCRLVALTGALVLSLGMLTSAFANSVGSLCVTFGVVGGRMFFHLSRDESYHLCKNMCTSYRASVKQ